MFWPKYSKNGNIVKYYKIAFIKNGKNIYNVTQDFLVNKIIHLF